MSTTLLSARVADDELIRRYRFDGNLEARRLMIERYLPFARRLALSYRHTSEPLEDLAQVASVGLIGAVERYDPARGPFKGFAAPTILGELKRHFRDKTWSVRVPRDLQERIQALGRVTERLSVSLGRSPTLDELSQELSWTLEQILEASEAVHSRRPRSLDAPLSDDVEGAGTLVELVGSPDPGFELVAQREQTAAIWRAMPQLEREAIIMRFRDNLTQREIAARIGCSQMHISRVLRRALDRLLRSQRAHALA